MVVFANSIFKRSEKLVRPYLCYSLLDCASKDWNEIGFFVWGKAVIRSSVKMDSKRRYSEDRSVNVNQLRLKARTSGDQHTTSKSKIPVKPSVPGVISQNLETNTIDPLHSTQLQLDSIHNLQHSRQALLSTQDCLCGHQQS